ncbi:MAG TPA: tetratricopeptide repeat protein [Vicinamibacteria bacterium]|nr:tetratricopeptide repeat protein [Vicinamibacteria bacterium]
MRVDSLPLVRQLWQDHRDRLALAGLVAAFLGLFALTSALTAAYRSKEESLAEDWYEKGVRALDAREPEQAISDFRNALAWSRNNPAYQLRLAQALLASGRGEDAGAYLLTLRRREPGHGLVNLELARLAARAGHVQEAHRYYHDAIYGVWESDVPSWRRRARLELVEFLLGQGERAEAGAELRPLAQDLPPDAAAHAEVGRLFLRAGDPTRALAQFKGALEIEAGNAQALAGATEAAFALGRYPAVVEYGERALRREPRSADLSSRVETARQVLALDPARARLSGAERGRRVRRVFDVALAELDRCAAGATPSPELAGLLRRAHDLRPRLRPPALQRDLELREGAFDLALEAVRLASRACGEPAAPAPRAVLLLAGRNGTGG